MPKGNALIITAKYPEPGTVKTRLAGRWGPEYATDLYRAFLRDMDAKFTRAFPTVYWAYTPADSPFPDFLGPARSYLTQEGDDLGTRMLNLFRTLFVEGYDKVVLIGSDLPHLSPSTVEEAFERLEKSDVVLGPAEDGGYYLVGMRAIHDIFSGVAWSTPLVFAQTMTRIAEQELSVDVLPKTFDVDEPQDVERLMALPKNQDLQDSMRCTAAVLSRLHIPDMN